MDSLLTQSSKCTDPGRLISGKQVKGRLFRSNTEPQVSEGDDPNLVELFQVIEESNQSTDVPAPRLITLERQLFQSVLISWKPPELSSMNENKIVSAYHIYVDGQFRLAVMAKEKTRALLDNVDADKPHRISIRSISSHGQSKDAQCTLVVGRGMTATPARLKATQIGTKSAKLSWIPGNSNYYHRVYLNECPLHLCKPGVYKLHLTDLPPDTLHQVCIQALPSPNSTPEPIQQPPPWNNASWSGVYTQKLAAFIEFRTLPIGLPDPPSNVQIEAGPQDGMLLITWLPVPQDRGAADAVTAAGAGSSLPVQGYTVCLNGQAIMELKGASRDHAILRLCDIRDHVQRLTNTSTSLHNNNNSINNSNIFSNQSSSSKFSNPVLNSTAYATITELYITVHSTVPLNSLNSNINQSSIEISSSEQASNTSTHCTLLKGSEGPASKPIRLTPCLLIAAAGSLEAAYTVFGPSLAIKIGINEDAARKAGVSLSIEGKQETSAHFNPQLIEKSVSGDDNGLLIVSAETVVRKPSPTADALGSAEALLLRRKLEKQELSDETPSSSDHFSGKGGDNSNQISKAKNSLHQSFRDTANVQKSLTDRSYYNDQNHHHYHHHHPHRHHQRNYHQPHNPKHTKYKWRQTRSISNDYGLNAKYDLLKDGYHSDEASINSSLSSESSKTLGNRWFRTSSSYNLTTDYPNRQWRPRGATKSNLHRGYPFENHECLTNERITKREGIRRKNLLSLYDSGIYPGNMDQNFGYSGKHPQSFKDSAYTGRISPEARYDILTKYGTRRLLDSYPTSRYSRHDVNPMSSSSNEERYLDSALNNRSHISHGDYFDRFPISNILTTLAYPVNVRSRSTSPKHIHIFSAPVNQPRNIESEYNFPNASSHRTPRSHRPLPMGIESRRRPIRGRYYSTHGNPFENLSLPEIQITRNSSFSDNEPQFQIPDPHHHQQSQSSYQNIHGPTRPIRSRFMDTRRHGSYDPQISQTGFSTIQHHDPAFTRHPVPVESLTPGPKRSMYHNMPSPVTNPKSQHDNRPPFNQGNLKSYRINEPGFDSLATKSGSPRQAAVFQHQHQLQHQQQQQQSSSQYPRSGKLVTQDEQQYNMNQRYTNGEYPVRMMSTELKPIRVVVALYDYDPATMSPNIDGVQEELPFREGQLIKILTECDEDGFYLGECNGLRGLVPSNMVSELVESDLSKGQKSNHPVDSRTNLIETNLAPPGQVTKARSMDITSQSQLNSSGHNYYLTRKHDHMIQQAYSVPRNSDFIHEPVFHPPVTVPGYSQAKDMYTDEVTQDYNHQPKSQKKYNTSLHISRTIQSKQAESVRHQQDQEARIMIAIYDYDPHVLSPNADADAELSFKSGEQITVFGDMDDDGFYYGETRDGRRGLVPSNFLQPCTNETNFTNKQINSSVFSSQLTSTNPRDNDRLRLQNNRPIGNREQACLIDSRNQSTGIQSQSNPTQYENAKFVRNTKLETVPNSEKEKSVYTPRSTSPRLQTGSYGVADTEATDVNRKSTKHFRNDLDHNGVERFQENEDSIIVMDLNPYPNNSNRKSNFPSLNFSRGSSHDNDNVDKDYDTAYGGSHESTSGDIAGSGYSQRRRSTIRSLFKRE
ncbi:unnamed protein product [Heterobilharzia americana]|nr:unnamed protein product [Heterobilharzia americana]